jgi:hypothetical protein
MRVFAFSEARVRQDVFEAPKFRIDASAHLVAYVDQADTREIAHADKRREVIVTLPEMPAEPFVVLRLREVTNREPGGGEQCAPSRIRSCT